MKVSRPKRGGGMNLSRLLLQLKSLEHRHTHVSREREIGTNPTTHVKHLTLHI